jgi:hypothetical protein
VARAAGQPPRLPVFVNAKLARALLAAVDADAAASVPDPGLFVALRRGLLGGEVLLDLADADESAWASLRVGEIVELRGELIRNPVADLLEAVEWLWPHARDLPETRRPQRGGAAPTAAAEQAALAVFRLAAGDADDAPTGDVLFRLAGSEVTCLVTLPRDLGGLAIDDLIGVQVRLLGKVVRLIGPDESVSLVRRSRLGSTAGEVLRSGFAQLSSGADLPFVVPDVDVTGPSMQLLPVAIYV